MEDQVPDPNIIKRQLAAILFADVAGYSRLTGRGEEGTRQKLDAAPRPLTGSPRHFVRVTRTSCGAAGEMSGFFTVAPG